ncbi:hypothetical protein [Pseudomonas zeae]|uniref:Uncharacterized protein n=1 Tax=Pseudomonas zeae TaxID=2745510 RepID=A0A9E6NQ30_9PSED|nr:hypothetical protein [Pseudomonas zeae]QXI11789.1 hypothetical protein HU754_029080 [Pseudomonas zeae]
MSTKLSRVAIAQVVAAPAWSAFYMDRNDGGVFIICGCLRRNEREIFGVTTPLANLNAPE